MGNAVRLQSLLQHPEQCRLQVSHSNNRSFFIVSPVECIWVASFTVQQRYRPWLDVKTRVASVHATEGTAFGASFLP